MKYFPRLELYKASNVTFDPKKIEAKSYGWWVFVAKIDGVVYFNNFTYSNTTTKHQSKMRGLLKELNIKYVDIECPKGFQNINAFEDAREMYQNRIKLLEEAIDNPKSNNKTNVRRLKQIEVCLEKLDILQQLETA